MPRCGDSTLLALVVSDIHDDDNKLDELRKWIAARGLANRIDFVLSPGDFATAPQELSSDSQYYTARAQRIIDALARVSNAPIYFVPGNHDALSLYNHTSSTTAHNVHNRLVQLAPGLWLTGFGGGSTAFEAGQPVWPGYPLDEPTIAAGYASLPRPASTDSLLLLPHCGPRGVGTTTVTGTDPNNLSIPGVRANTIESGSPSLTSYLSQRSVQRQVTAVLHGHTHAGVGSGRLGRLPIVNPGSLRYGGRFGLLTLQRGHTGRWHVGSVQLHALRSPESSSHSGAAGCDAEHLRAVDVGSLCSSSGGGSTPPWVWPMVALPWTLLIVLCLRWVMHRVAGSSQKEPRLAKMRLSEQPLVEGAALGGS